MNRQADVVIVGTGAAGLFCALKLPANRNILMITKDEVDRSDSFLAQGGICMLRGEEDYDSYFEDTLKAGHYENDRASVDVMLRSSQQIISDLAGYGVEFEKDGGGYMFTREGGHSRNRILFHADITGREITGKLLARAVERENIQILDHTMMIDILCDDPADERAGGQDTDKKQILSPGTGDSQSQDGSGNRISGQGKCYGVIVREADGTAGVIRAGCTVLACGGLGGLFKHTTNFRHITGDALAVALAHGIHVKNMDYIQIHPTTLYSEKPGRRFLISESVRGEGAILLDKNKERFVNELLPRDVVTAAIRDQMEKDGMPYVWLSLENIPEEEIRGHFPNIYERCLEEGYDATKEPIPVVPAQHYFMGGIQVDLYSRTSMENLYAVGETSCNGVHGRNRLASNSLLESMVFADRAAADIRMRGVDAVPEDVSRWYDPDKYQDLNALKERYSQMVLEQINRKHSGS